MWLWQRNVLPKKYLFLLRICVAITAVHLLLLLILFMYTGGTQRIDFKRVPASVMFMPLYKTIEGAQQSTANGKDASNVGSLQVIRGASASLGQAAAHNKGEQVVVQSSAQSTTIMSDLPNRKKTSRVKAQRKKKQEQKKRNKKDEKKGKKSTQEAKKKNDPIVEKKHEQEHAVVQPSNIEVVQGQSDVGQGSLFVGQEDMDILELNHAIRTQIETTWHPPVGMSGGHGCIVRLIVDLDGKAQDITFEESSHVVAFDTSVRHALLKMTFPKTTYGKELIIPFK